MKHAITIERSITGWLILSALVRGYLVVRKYQGYTVREAKELFHLDVRA